MDTNKILREAVIDLIETEQLAIKPCPFCGGKPEIMDEEMFERLKEVDENNMACITIKCSKCHLAFYDYTNERDYFVRKFLVVEKWNRRAE